MVHDAIIFSDNTVSLLPWNKYELYSTLKAPQLSINITLKHEKNNWKDYQVLLI